LTIIGTIASFHWILTHLCINRHSASASNQPKGFPKGYMLRY